MLITISIRDSRDVLIKPGQKVDFNTPLFQDETIKEIIIPIAKKLNVPSAKIFRYLQKFVGDKVEKGEILATKKTLLSTNRITSESSGVIQEIDHTQGTIIVKSSQKNNKTHSSYFKGEVTDVKKTTLTIKVTEGKEYPLKMVSNNFGGRAFYLEKQSLSDLREDQVSRHVLISDSLSPYLQSKTEALDIKGYIVLRNPPQESTLPIAQIKNIDDFAEALKVHYEYCLIEKNSDKIYFYR